MEGIVRLVSIVCLAPFLVASLLAPSVPARAQSDPLPSWNDGQAKRSIVSFVKD